jgi:hypothetical protein
MGDASMIADLMQKKKPPVEHSPYQVSSKAPQAPPDGGQSKRRPMRISEDQEYYDENTFVIT